MKPSATQTYFTLARMFLRAKLRKPLQGKTSHRYPSIIKASIKEIESLFFHWESLMKVAEATVC